MTTPTIVPTGFDKTSKDFLKAKVERDGCLRCQYSTVSIPAATATGTVVGIVPFQKGFRMGNNGTKLAIGSLGTGATIDIGYAYATGSSETDDTDAFATALTTAVLGGFLTFDEPTTGLPFVAADKGWIVGVIGGAAVTTTGSLYGQVVGCYDGLSAAN